MQSPWERYSFGLLMAALALGVKVLVSPLSGWAAPYVIFFTATLVTALFAGTGPGLVTLFTCLPLGAYLFVVRAGTPVSQAFFQALLFAVDGVVVLYLMALLNRRRLRLDDANRELITLRDGAERAAVRTHEILELAPDAFFLSDLAARFTNVNRAACRLLGYERDELIAKTIFDIIPAEDAARLEATRSELLEPGRIHHGEWRLRRKDGSLVPVEVSATILSDGRWQAFIRDITERKHVEDQRQVFISLLDNSVDFIGIADPSGKPIYLNAAGRRMIGLSPDFPVERIRIQDCYPPELSSFVTDVLLKTMTEQGVWSGETFFQNLQTQERIPVSDTHFLIRDASGQRILGMGTVTRDISEARRIADEREQLLAREQKARGEIEFANAQLRESEERFRLTIDEAPIGMALVRLDGQFVRVNQALCEITGYSADELLARRFQDITHPHDLDKDVDIARRLARGEIPRYQFEKRYLRKDGSIVDVMLNVSTLKGPTDTPLYFITQIEDITSRKQAEHALRLSEAKFSGIISIAADAIISVDAQQRITIFNHGAESIFGYAAGEALGAHLERLIPERFREAHRAHFADFAAGDEAARTIAGRRDVFGLRKNGEEFPAEASISKVAVGEETLFSVVLRDITARKQVERALQQAVSARENVLRIVAHDLRNPLSAILMQASMLERPGPEPERRDPQPRQVILRAATRMNQLIQDLLDVALADAGQMRIAPEPLPAADLVRDAVEMETPIAEAAKISIRLDVNDVAEDVWGDRRRLLQVFENLIGNAVKFTKPGGEIVVGAARQGDDVAFSVADTGAGMAQETAEHVFDRFWQATTREKRLGAGLGLAIVKGIVEAHGGRVWLDTMLGRGSTFSFSIPMNPRSARTSGGPGPSPDTDQKRRRTRSRAGH